MTPFCLPKQATEDLFDILYEGFLKDNPPNKAYSKAKEQIAYTASIKILHSRSIKREYWRSVEKEVHYL